MNYSITTLCIAALITGCGGGGSDSVTQATPSAAPSAASTTTTGTTNTTTAIAAPAPSSNTSVTTTAGTTSSGAPTYSETTGLWSGDTIQLKPITDQKTIDRFAAARAAESQAFKERDDTKYPSAGNGSFAFFVGVTPDSAAFKTYGTTIIVGNMKSLTAARLAACVIAPDEYSQEKGDCNLSTNVEPLKYIDSTKRFNCTLFYTWAHGGNIEYCVPRS